jgi:excisionase family DNA binding protein
MSDESDRVDIGQEHVQGLDISVSTPLSIREAAALAGVTEKTIRRWIQNGRLTSEKIGGQHQIAAADLAAARVDTPPVSMSRPTSTHETSEPSNVQTPRVDNGQHPVSSGVDLRPLIEHIASLEDRVQSLTEAATLWQYRARQLEEQLKQLTAGPIPNDVHDDDQTAPEAPQTHDVAPGRTEGANPGDESKNDPASAQKSGFSRWWAWITGG